MLIDELRPKNIKDIVGMRAQLAALAQLYQAGKAPCMVLLAGEPGSGKTSLAKLLAKAAEFRVNPFEVDLAKYKTGATVINAATQNGIDDIRALISNSQFGRIDGGASAVILNEVQALTKQAQKGLLDFTEFPPEDFYLYMTTSDLSALDKALVERFHVITTRALSTDDLKGLVARGLKHLGAKLNGEKVAREFMEKGILFPRQVLSNVERLHFGVEVLETEEEKANAFAAVQDLCRSGSTAALFEYLKGCTVAEAKSLRFLLLSYMNTMNLGGSGKAADAILKLTGPYPFEEAAFKPWLGASIRMVSRIFAAKVG